ncbi:MAG: aldo/keto reductase [Lacrimispora saccharolytica]
MAAAKYEKPLAAVAIRYILDYLPESVVLCGAKRPEQVLGNAEGMDWKLEEEDLRILDQVSGE